MTARRVILAISTLKFAKDRVSVEFPSSWLDLMDWQCSEEMGCNTIRQLQTVPSVATSESTSSAETREKVEVR